MKKDTVLRLAEEIMTHLTGAERSQDCGLASRAKLFATLIDARLQLGLAHSSHRALVAEAGKLLTEEIEERGRMIALHDQFADIGDRLGVDVTAIGDSGDKSDLTKGSLETSRVRLAAAA